MTNRASYLRPRRVRQNEGAQSTARLPGQAIPAARTNMARQALYVGAGADGQWGTADDVMAAY